MQIISFLFCLGITLANSKAIHLIENDNFLQTFMISRNYTFFVNVLSIVGQILDLLRLEILSFLPVIVLADRALLHFNSIAFLPSIQCYFGVEILSRIPRRNPGGFCIKNATIIPPTFYDFGQASLNSILYSDHKVF